MDFFTRKLEFCQISTLNIKKLYPRPKDLFHFYETPSFQLQIGCYGNMKFHRKKKLFEFIQHPQMVFSPNMHFQENIPSCYGDIQNSVYHMIDLNIHFHSERVILSQSKTNIEVT